MDGTSQRAQSRFGAFSGRCRVHVAASRATVADERGAALVEFALVASLLLVLLFAIAEFGVTYSNYLTLQDAVRVGAREASIAGTDPCGAATTVVQGQLPGASVSCTDIASGEPFTVTATYPYSIDIIGLVVREGHMTSKVTERRED